MRTPPNRFGVASVLALLAAALCSACTARANPQPPEPQLSAEAGALSQPPSPAEATIGGERPQARIAVLETPEGAPSPPSGLSESVALEQARGDAGTVVDSGAALAQVRDQIAALRSLMEAQNDALRSEIEKLKREQSKPRAPVEQEASRTTRGAVAAPLDPSVARGSEVPATTVADHAPAPTIAADSSAASVAHDETAALAAARGAEAAGSATVIVSGSVNKPGVYTVGDVKTVGGAVSAAGRLDDANLSAVEIRPEDQGSALLGLGLGGHPNKRIVDLTAVASGKGPDLPVRGGEVIFVPAIRR
jgi:hypothetical protein